MILYLDASALVKSYIAEPGTDEVAEAIAQAEVVGTSLIARAAALAWELSLRGYDAVHLASALLWQEGMGEEVIMATFDQPLRAAAGQLNAGGKR